MSELGQYSAETVSIVRCLGRYKSINIAKQIEWVKVLSKGFGTELPT